MEVRLFKKPEEVIPRDIPARVQRMTREELISWFDTLIMQTGSAFDAWRFHDAPIQDAVMAINAASDLLYELQMRSKSS